MDRRLLTVDLGTGQIGEQVIDPAYVRDYIGGSSLAARFLWDSLDPKRDPLDPASPLLWLTGPLTGTGGPTNGRSTICARSPQTGLWGESNIGGFVGSEIRYAGYDGILITGRSPTPVYLWLHNGRAELRDASHLWGKADTYETQRALRAELGEPMARVAAIGPSGENQVPFAAVLSDHGRLAGRTGMGALMGSKNCKAIAVRGTGKIEYARPDEYKQMRVQVNKNLVAENLTSVLRATGTSGAADYFHILGDMPIRYWTAGAFEGAEHISGGTMAQTILTGVTACQGCVIACGREVTVTGGPYATGGKAKGPEYETICTFGSQLMVDDLPLITALGNHCDALGMDVISAGNTIALAYLMFDRGILTPADTGGLDLRWGDATPCFALMDQMAHREGFGALLAQGARSLAAHYGVEELAAHVNNLEVPMHDPRGISGMALVYLTSPRGACHNQSDYFMVEIGQSIDELNLPKTDPLEDSGKAACCVVVHQDWRTVCNALVMCLYANTPPSDVARLLSAASGQDWNVEELMQAGERGWQLKRAFNIRLGLTRESERLPMLLTQPLAEGGSMGHVPNTALMLKEYYAARGWDPETGKPTPQRLKTLGMDFTIPVIWPE